MTQVSLNQVRQKSCKCKLLVTNCYGNGMLRCSQSLKTPAVLCLLRGTLDNTLRIVLPNSTLSIKTPLPSLGPKSLNFLRLYHLFLFQVYPYF